ncbi:MAG: hypothetical protein ACKOEO_21095, partial [Planctomycetaceae bacterium]
MASEGCQATGTGRTGAMYLDKILNPGAIKPPVIVATGKLVTSCPVSASTARKFCGQRPSYSFYCME